MKPPPTRAFTDRIYRISAQGSITLPSGKPNGDYLWRCGWWLGRERSAALDFSAAVLIDVWTHPRSTPHTRMTLVWGNRQILRWWEHEFAERTLSRLARQMLRDAIAGDCGKQ